MKKILLLSTMFVLLGFITASGQQSVDRSKAPALAEIQPLKLPALQSFKLKNGMNVYLMEKSQVPLVQVTLYINGGAAYEKQNELGLSSLVANMMDEGTKTRTSLQIADEIDYLGINLSVFSNMEQMGVSLFAPLSKFDPALELMKDITVNPVFPKDELERKRKDILVGLVQEHDEARAIASKAFAKLIFGDSHPYGRSTNGTEATVKSFTVDQLKKYHAEMFTPNNAYMIVVGDVKKADIQQKLEKHFSGWSSGKPKSIIAPEAKQISGRVVYLIDKPDAAQSEIRIGRVGVGRDTKEFFALQVMNTILGGSFTSRLNQNLRETHGYAYGASSGFAMRKSKGYFIASSSVQTDVTDKALTEFMKELTNIRSVTDDELNRAKNYEALSYPDNFSSVQSVVGNLNERLFYTLSETYFNDYMGNVLGVTRDQVERVAKQYIDTDNMIILVVGDRSKIEAGIRALNLGEVKILSKEDVLGSVPKL